MKGGTESKLGIQGDLLEEIIELNLERSIKMKENK